MPPDADEKPRLRRHRGRPRRESAGRDREVTRTRLLALRVLERVQRAGAYADILLHAHLGRSSLPAPDRAFATDLVYGTLRWRGRIDFMLSQVLDRDLEKLEPLVANALRLGAYQILFSDRVPDNAAVDESVRCIRAAGAERATGLVNAVLRRLAAEHASIPLPALETDPVGHLTHALSLPAWLAARWVETWGAEDAAALARACNAPPPLTIRANRRRTTAAELLQELLPRFPDARPCALAEDGIVLGRRGNPAVDPAFLAGKFTVQDEASQLVVSLLDPRPGERVLDACAAPGGKATAIAERVGPEGHVVALDRNPRRLDLVKRQARRLGHANVECIDRDAARPFAELAPPDRFDRVLVDAPCSGLGTLRRNADARWRVRASDPERLAEVQGNILRHAAACLRPGGVLVYSTCTLLHEENEDIVERFLAENAAFRAAAPGELPERLAPVLDDAGALRCLPHIHDTDGFYAARLVRNP
jgi:16S rRNA (cytosine967-C5)-methyltransferase